MRPRRGWWALGALLAILVAAGYGMAGPGTKPARAGAHLVGPDACGDCHPDLLRAWSLTTHARTLVPATPANVPKVMAEGGRIVHPPEQSEFRRDGDRIFVTTMGPKGVMESYPVEYVLGARRVRMYVTSMPDGRREVLPFMLDEPNGRFFDYTDLLFGARGTDPNRPPVVRPGEPSFWTGYTRYFDALCGRCHTTGWEFRGPSDDPKAPQSTWFHAGVTCESCHGPASRHVDYWNDKIEGEDPIPSLSKADPAAVNELCVSCHTEGETVAPGFRLGERAFDHYDPAILDDPERLDPTGRPLELVYDGVPFAVSTCARKGGLTCMTCHDPHGSPYRAQLKAAPGSPELCVACHADVVKSGSAHSRHDPKRVGGECTSCHMPRLTVERGNGVVTDHTIGVPDPEFAGKRIATDACTWCHTGLRGAPGGVPRLTRDEIVAAYRKWWPDAGVRPDFATVLNAGRNGDPDSVKALEALAKDETRVPVVRASAVALLGRFPERAAPTLFSLARDPESLVRRHVATALAGLSGPDSDSVLFTLLLDDSPAVRLAAARAALSGWDRIRRAPSLVESIERVLVERTNWYPEDDGTWFLLGGLRQIRGDRAGAIAAYEKKLALDPYARLVRQTLDALRRGR